MPLLFPPSQGRVVRMICARRGYVGGGRAAARTCFFASRRGYDIVFNKGGGDQGLDEAPHCVSPLCAPPSQQRLPGSSEYWGTIISSRHSHLAKGVTVLEIGARSFLSFGCVPFIIYTSLSMVPPHYWNGKRTKMGPDQHHVFPTCCHRQLFPDRLHPEDLMKRVVYPFQNSSKRATADVVVLVFGSRSEPGPETHTKRIGETPKMPTLTNPHHTSTNPHFFHSIKSH